MGAHILLTLVNDLRKKDKMRGFAKDLIVFNEFNKFNNISA